jgi:hypothetical protein
MLGLLEAGEGVERDRSTSSDTVSTVDHSPGSRSPDSPERAAAPSASGGGASEENLVQLHACLHCRASKTACTDVRPCTRCCRLGLDCSSDRDQPRKRACKSCHAAKVACGTDFTDGACNRCRRLGHACVPRDSQSVTRSVRQRRRGGVEVDVEASAEPGAGHGLTVKHLLDAGTLTSASLGPVALGIAPPAVAPAGSRGTVQAAETPPVALTSPGSPGADLMASVAISLLNLSRNNRSGSVGSDAEADAEAAASDGTADATIGAFEPPSPITDGPRMSDLCAKLNSVR